MTKARLADDELLPALAREHGTPLYVYDLATVRSKLESLAAFDVVRYAQKANSNLALLAFLARHGAHVDAVSAGEIERALVAGIPASAIVYTADLFDRASLELVREHELHVNAGSANMLPALADARPGADITLRVNPGFGEGSACKVTTGGRWSKHGIWHADLGEAVELAARLGLSISGLHVHIGSGGQLAELQRTADCMVACARELPGPLTTLSAGGGLPVPYRKGEEPADVERYAAVWTKAKQAIESSQSAPLSLETEPGRYLVAECGLLLCEVLSTKSTDGVDFVIVDAGFHTLVRPAMYGSYHRISALGRTEGVRPRVVAGPLCESADVFTQDERHQAQPQELPAVEPGDLLCIHDVGAYGASMASNYNSRPMPAEVVVEDGTARLARRRQTTRDLYVHELELD